MKQKLNDKVAIKIEDNDIPQNIIDKLSQPFFTTKPIGQGRDVGLSFAYKNIAKEYK